MAQDLTPGLWHRMFDFTDYGDESDGEGTFLLYRDDWIAVTNFERGAQAGRVVDLPALRRLQILMPPLLAAQRRQLRTYCTRHGLPEPTLAEDDVGTFPRLSRDSEPFALLAPRSLVAAGLSRLQLDHATFDHCNLTMSRFPRADLHAASFIACKAPGSDFEDADFSRRVGRNSVALVTFSECILDMASFRGAMLDQCNLEGSSLTQADFTGVIRMDVTQVMGGTKIIVPAHWEVRSEITAIFAGFEDKRQQPAVTNPEKVLILDGTSFFGGIELKNF